VRDPVNQMGWIVRAWPLGGTQKHSKPREIELCETDLAWPLRRYAKTKRKIKTESIRESDRMDYVRPFSRDAKTQKHENCGRMA
jgi:hypothetical protein